MIRLLDAGSVPAVRSQALYHGLAHARTDATPDTIVVATPSTPYACIGLHQDLDRAVDRDACAREGIPVFRRDTGGGAVYIDSDQVFVQWVMGGRRLPARVDARFELFCRPLVDTLRALGLEAAFRPVNDVHVRDRKISGTGAARIGEAEVLVGNLIFDFDVQACARVLWAPSEPFRRELERSLEKYMTSIRRELDAEVERGPVLERYRRECERALGDELFEGRLTDEELACIEEQDRRLASSEQLHQAGGLTQRGVKIHRDVHVLETERPIEGGRLRVTARTNRGRVETIALVSERGGARVELDELAASLRGVALERTSVQRALERYRDRRGATPELPETTWVETLLTLDRRPTGHPT